MKSLSQFIKEECQQLTTKQLHDTFKDTELDQNETILKLIDKYCPNGGIVGYECQDSLMHEPNNTDHVNVESTIVTVPNTDIQYNINVMKCLNGEAYTISIIGNTTIYIFGNPMKTLKESIELDRQITEGENTELNKYIEKCLNECIKTGKTFDEVVDEGLFGALVGGITGATIGSSIMKAICKVLGIDERGVLGGLLTSRTVMAAMGANLGYRI